MKIWQRYLFFRLLRSFLFMLACALAIYAVVDLATHTGKFFLHGPISPLETALYYLYQYSALLGFFFPLAFLLALIQVLLDLNAHHELVALQMAGLSKKKLLKPCFSLAALLSLISLANQQWIAPLAQGAAETFVAEHTRHKKKQVREHVHEIVLEHGTDLVYQSFDENGLFDVFWIQSPSQIWHMKFLDTSSDPPIGRFVDRFKRGASGQLEKIESFERRPFSKIAFDKEIAFQPFIPFENRSLSHLAAQICAGSGDQPNLLAHLLYKLAQPLFIFLAIFGAAPICMRFSRSQPTFFIAACSIAAILALKTLLDGMLILGENQVLPPAIALVTPLALAAAFSYRPFSRL